MVVTFGPPAESYGDPAPDEERDGDGDGLRGLIRQGESEGDVVEGAEERAAGAGHDRRVAEAEAGGDEGAEAVARRGCVHAASVAGARGGGKGRNKSGK